jgi:ATP-dependent helicase/nuclease subunit A
MGRIKPKQILADQEARDRIRCDLETTLVVEAAAGTGKTSALVGRMVAAIRSGKAQLDRIIAVTFTDAAAGELKLRLRAAIEEGRQDSECPDQERQRLTAALPQLEEARIGTIHSFCADLLRERPVEAGIDPLFEVAADEIARPIFDLAFDRWFEQQLADPGEAIRRVLRRRAGDEGPKGVLKGAAIELAKWRDFPTRWRRDEAFDRQTAIDSLLEEMRRIGEWASTGDPEQWFTKSLLAIDRFVQDVTRLERVRPRDYDALEAELISFNRESRHRHWNWKGYYRNDSFPRQQLLDQRNALKQKLQEFVDRAGADLSPQLRDELWPVIEEFQRLKERSGYLDFFDLLLCARDLVRDKSPVRSELQRRFTHIYVDEFQDTDPLQAELLMLLAADDPNERDWRRVRPIPGKLFIVGDPKQSIYRFRRADVALYQQVKKRIVEAGGAVVNLNVSFRSVPQIQQAVNAAFAAIMNGASSTQAEYVALLPDRPGVDTQPAVIALPVPKPYSDFGRITNWSIDESLPQAVAAFVGWLIHESGWTVTEREQPDARVPIKARHVCLLFRRFRSFRTDVTQRYVRALEARRLPHLLVGGTSFHEREEVEAVRNALCAIERPDDELAVFATLKGPLFALSDGQLLAYRHRCRTLHPFKQPPPDLPEPLLEVTEALAVLRNLHRGRNGRPIADTIGNLLAATRAHAGFANWPTGEQALANVARLMDMARRAERNGLISFRSFVDWLNDQAANGEAGDAPIIEEGVDGVRIMTVHKAKGLEFPVVILADLTAREAREPSRWSDPQAGLCVMRLAGCAPPELQEHSQEEMQLEREEAARVLYVAATRARDLLVVSAVGDQPFDGWLAGLNRAIYPPVGDSFNPETGQPGGCPRFGDDNVVERQRNARRPPGSVTPGLHRPEAGEQSVVWWDPSLLELDREEGTGSRLNKLLTADDRKKRSEAGILAHAQWQAKRTSVRERAGTPSLRVLTATEFAEEQVKTWSDTADGKRASDEALRIAVEEVGELVDRPHGPSFGMLVHSMLSLLDLEADREGVRVIAELQGRVLGSSDQEVAAATEIVTRALVHPLLRRAAQASKTGRCRRETPVSLRLEDGILVEGIVDLAFVEEFQSGWTVVDFKTDLELKGRLMEYRHQVALYARAISRATGASARGVILKL